MDSLFNRRGACHAKDNQCAIVVDHFAIFADDLHVLQPCLFLEDFEPEDITYSTFRWITTDSAWAMGPSRANPLTGEIIDGDHLERVAVEMDRVRHVRAVHEPDLDALPRPHRERRILAEAAPVEATAPVEVAAVEAAPIAPEGFAVVKHEDPTASCSWAGESFAPNARGEITVPVAAVAALAAHGFAPVEAPAAQAETEAQG